MKQIHILLALLFVVLLPGAAQAQTCPSGWGCVNVFSRNNTWSGTNTATGVGTYTPSTTECPSAAGTLTPAHNVIQCVMAGNITMALPSTFTPYQPITEVLTENSTGGFTLTPCTACEFPPSMINTSGQVAISTAPNSENEVQCTTVTIASTNKLHCTVAAGFGTAVPSFSVGSYYEGFTSGQNVTSTSITNVALTNGSYLFVVHYGCAAGSNCASGNVPTQPSGVAIASGTGTLGTCALMTGATPTASPAVGILGVGAIEYCPITGSGTANVTVSMPSTDYPHELAFVVTGILASPDEGVGKYGTGNSASPSVATNGTPNQVANFMLAAFATANPPTVGSGWTQAAIDSSNYLIVEWQTSMSPTGNVTATITQTTSTTPNYSGMIGAFK